LKTDSARFVGAVAIGNEGKARSPLPLGGSEGLVLVSGVPTCPLFAGACPKAIGVATMSMATIDTVKGVRMALTMN